MSLADEAFMRREGLGRTMTRLLVGFDGSPPSRRALEHALRRAAAAKDEVVLLNVLPAGAERSSLAAMMPPGVELPPRLAGTFLEHARARMDETVKEASAKGVPVSGLVRMGPPAATLLAVADEAKAGEIVIGHKSFEGPAFTLGPNADAILRGAKVPVTVVP
jgi:nucleotide-binding universal stress UspA family protein